MSSLDEVRGWLFRAISFETDAKEFSLAGFRVGADASKIETSVWDAMLSAFRVDIRSSAMRMAQLYALMYCFENSVRDLVAQRLSEDSEDWWKTKVSNSIQQSVQKVYESAVANAWLDGERSRMIDFTTFGQLVKIILDNWTDFSFLIPTQAWLNQKMGEMETSVTL